MKSVHKRLVFIFLLFITASTVTTGQACEGQRSPNELQLARGVRLLSEDKTDSAQVIFTALTSEALGEKEPAVFVRAHLNIGRIYGDRGENVIALQHYQKALQKAESLQDKNLIAPVLKNIGVLYISWKRFDDALAYYERAEGIAREVNNEELIADCQNNKGTVYEQRKEYDKAIAAYKNALDVYTRKNIPGKIAMALSNVAIVYKFQKNYQESLNYNFKAILLAESTGDKWSMAATYNNIGNLYGAMGRYNEAIVYCEKALVIAQEINAHEIIESIYDSMAEAAATAGDYKKAFEYHRLFSESLSEFVNTEYTRQLSELNIKYETEKKQTLIQQQKFEIARKNYLLLIASAIFILLCVAAYLIWRNYKYKIDKKQQEEIKSRQEIEARALFEGEQNERIRIARDLHDGVGQMLALVKMNMSALNIDDAVTKKTMSMVDQTIDEVRNVSHNLIPEELNFGIFSALENLVERINASDNTTMEMTITPEVKSREYKKQDELSIYRIIQEIVSNIVKHAGASKILLSIRQDSGGVVLSIQDNGRGMNIGTIQHSKGIGWKNISARVHLLNGKMSVQAAEPTGTQIDIMLP